MNDLQRVGERIKTLRLSKLMTQSELAGTKITRNMLSSIENGAALPSLPTALYLAERLGVPVGYLLADKEEEFAYRKMLSIANIRRAFAAGDFAGCLSIIRNTLGDEQDDEIALIYAECEFGLACEALQKGSLRRAAVALDCALAVAKNTVYDTAAMRDRIAVAFRYLSGISGTLASDILDASEVEAARATGDALIEYITALEDLEKGGEESADAYLTRYPHTLFAARLSALVLMKHEHFREAQNEIEALLARDDLTFGVLMYELFGDMELCCRQNDDYKRAYEFSGARLDLLERLLEDA